MTTSRILLALAALALPLSACSKEPADPYDTDSQSHWLQSCVSDSDCGGAYSCLCNVCVRTCADDPGACSDTLTATICAVTDAQAAQTLCANTLDVDVCLPPCTSCPDGWVCAGDACVPQATDTLDVGTSDAGTPDGGSSGVGSPDGGASDSGTSDASGSADVSSDDVADASECPLPDPCDGNTSLRRVAEELTCDRYFCAEDLPFDCPGAGTCDTIDDMCLTTIAGPPPEDMGSGEQTSCTPIPTECLADKSCECIQMALPGSDCALDGGAFRVSQALP